MALVSNLTSSDGVVGRSSWINKTPAASGDHKPLSNSSFQHLQRTMERYIANGFHCLVLDILQHHLLQRSKVLIKLQIKQEVLEKYKTSGKILLAL